MTLESGRFKKTNQVLWNASHPLAFAKLETDILAQWLRP
jgi:hypothetical protein